MVAGMPGLATHRYFVRKVRTFRKKIGCFDRTGPLKTRDIAAAAHFPCYSVRQFTIFYAAGQHDG